MATLPREVMQQAAQARAPQPAPQGQDIAGQVTRLLDQAQSLALQPQNFSVGGPVISNFARDWLVKMIQLERSKRGAPGQPGQAPGQPMSPSPAPMQPGAPATAAPTPVGTR